MIIIWIQEKIIIKQQNVIGGYNPKKYFSTVVYATARDGEKIPIYLVYNISLKKKESTATVVTLWLWFIRRYRRTLL